MADRHASPSRVARLMKEGIAPVHGAMYEERFPDLIMRKLDGDELLTEDELAKFFGVNSKQFEHWRDTIPAFTEAVHTMNTARRAYVERKAYNAALGDGDQAYFGDAGLLKMVLAAENPEKYSTKSVNINKNINETQSGLSKMLEGISSTSLDDHFAAVDYRMNSSQATQLVAEIFDALPEGYAEALRTFIALGVPEIPPAHLIHEDLPNDDPERLAGTATAQWLIKRGVSPRRSVSGGSFTLDGHRNDTHAQNDDVIEGVIVDDEPKGFFDV